MTRRCLLVLALVASALLGTSRGAGAQGFGVYEQSACAMALGGASVAAPCKDGSAIFFNPAAIAGQQRVASLGTTFIAPVGGFTDAKTGQQSDLLDRVYPVPNLYFIQPFKGTMAFGLGLFAPYGLSTEWPEDTSQGRFLGYKSKVEGIYIQPTFAIRPSKAFSIGFGLDLTLTRVELKQHVDLSVQPVPGAPAGTTWAALGVKQGTDFADVELKGDSTQVGFHVGALIQPSDRFSIGVRYLGRQKAEVEGDIATRQIQTGLRLPIQLGPYPAGTPVDSLLAPQFGSGATLGPQSATTEIYLPDQFVLGVAIQASPAVKILADYQYAHWELFDVLVLDGSTGLDKAIIENYGNTNGFRLGTEIGATDAFVFRAGFITHNAAAPDETVTPNLPEGDRNLYTVGFGWNLTKNFVFDFAYNYLQQDDRDGRTGDCGQAAPTVACNNGTYKFHANLIGAGLSLRF